MTFRYIDYDLVVAINAEHGGPGAGVRDEGLIRAQLGRAEQTFFGEDVYRTATSKAAVLLHGLAATQGFLDGNKRTAWLVAQLFLELNGEMMRKVPPVVAEAFVLSIATRAFEDEREGAERATKRAAEWFAQMRFRMRDRLDYAIPAKHVELSEKGLHTFNVTDGQVGGLMLSAFPATTSLFLLVRINFQPEDRYREWRLRAEIDPIAPIGRVVGPDAPSREYAEKHGDLPSDFSLERNTVPYCEAIALAFEDLSGRHPTGVTPSLNALLLPIQVFTPGELNIMLTVNGQFLARRTVRVDHLPGTAEADMDESIRNLLGG